MLEIVAIRGAFAGDLELMIAAHVSRHEVKFSTASSILSQSCCWMCIRRLNSWVLLRVLCDIVTAFAIIGDKASSIVAPGYLALVDHRLSGRLCNTIL